MSKSVKRITSTVSVKTHNFSVIVETVVVIVSV